LITYGGESNKKMLEKGVYGVWVCAMTMKGGEEKVRCRKKTFVRGTGGKKGHEKKSRNIAWELV